jgi:molecular chaperone DnaJ
MDHAYAMLGLAPGADVQSIKRAFRRLACERHPDHDPSPDASERFRALREAYLTLLRANAPVRAASVDPREEIRRRMREAFAAWLRQGVGDGIRIEVVFADPGDPR